MHKRPSIFGSTHVGQVTQDGTDFLWALIQVVINTNCLSFTS